MPDPDRRDRQGTAKCLLSALEHPAIAHDQEAVVGRKLDIRSVPLAYLLHDRRRVSTSCPGSLRGHGASSIHLAGKAWNVIRFVENREVRIAQVLIGMACPRDPSMINDQAGRCNSMAQHSVAVFSCEPPLLDMLRHACSHSRHLVAQSFMISPCPFARSSAQQRHASAQAWCA